MVQVSDQTTFSVDKAGHSSVKQLSTESYRIVSVDFSSSVVHGDIPVLQP